MNDKVLFNTPVAAFIEDHDTDLGVMTYYLCTLDGVEKFRVCSAWATLGKRAQLRQYALRRLEFKMAQRGLPVKTNVIFAN